MATINPDKSIAFHHEDHLSGASLTTNQKGNIIETMDYFPYGQVRIEEKSEGYKNDYLFTGQERDEETGLMYYRARYYDARVGRFASVDPWEGDMKDPQSLNKYSYVRNNPLKYVDETGEWFLQAAALAIAVGFNIYAYFNSAQPTNAPAVGQTPVAPKPEPVIVMEMARDELIAAAGVGAAVLGIKSAKPLIGAISKKIDDVLTKNHKLSQNYGPETTARFNKAFEWLDSRGVKIEEYGLGRYFRMQGRENGSNLTGEVLEDIYKNGTKYYDEANGNYMKIKNGYGVAFAKDDPDKIINVINTNDQWVSDRLKDGRIKATE